MKLDDLRDCAEIPPLYCRLWLRFRGWIRREWFSGVWLIVYTLAIWLSGFVLGVVAGRVR